MHLTDILDAISTWAQGIIQSLGYPGLGIIMFLENVFPPIPSELVLPLAGWLTLGEDAKFSLLGVTLVGALGSVAGAYFFYGLGRWLDESRVRWLLRRFGRWFMLSEDDLDVSLAWFNRYGEYVIFFGRMVPIVRSLISVPAGLAKMHLGKFTAYTAVGTALWSFVLAYAGRLLGANYERVSAFIDKYETLVIIGVLLALVYFFYRRWRKLRQQKSATQSVPTEPAQNETDVP